jgi:hypothetical protein
MEKLKVGDTFFLCEGVFVKVGHWCVESGREYDFPRDNSSSRIHLKDTITKELANEGIKHDPSIVDRFVNFIAKDIPAGNVHLPPGNFVVTHIEPAGGNNERVHCHREGDTTDVVYFLQNRTYGHYKFEALPTGAG